MDSTVCTTNPCLSSDGRDVYSPILWVAICS